jgi:tetratricopeptide (TPR) repeat protein
MGRICERVLVIPECFKCFILIAMRFVCVLPFSFIVLSAAAQTAKQASPSAVDELAAQRHIRAAARGLPDRDRETTARRLRLSPRLAEAQANLGAALAASGQFDAAIEEDIRAMAIVSDKTGVRRNLALAYYKKGDMEHARTEFEAVIAARPHDVNSAVLLGYTYIKLEKPAEAVVLLTPLEQGHESDMDFEYVLGDAMIQSGKDTDGIPRMEKAASATHSPDAYVIAGTAHMHRNEFREARADFDTALDLSPTFPGLYTLAGQARDAMGDADASVPAFQAALRADPKDATANLYLGVIRLKQRDFESARPLLELALELRPGHALTRLQLAKLNSMTGKLAEAAATLEDLEKSDPNWLDPHIELAAIYYKLHRPEEGQRERELVQQIEAKQQKAGPHPL